MSKKIPAGLRVIAIFKLISAFLLAATGFGIFHMLNTDIGLTLEHFVMRLHLDPEKHIINSALSAVSGLSHGKLKAIGAGTFFYALLYLVEGIGLLKGRHWAEYLVIIATGSLLPFEIYEIAEKVSGLRIGVLLINLLIVAYLIRQLRRDRQRHAPVSAA